MKFLSLARASILGLACGAEESSARASTKSSRSCETFTFFVRRRSSFPVLLVCSKTMAYQVSFDLQERTYCIIDRIHFAEASSSGAFAGRGSNIPLRPDVHAS